MSEQPLLDTGGSNNYYQVDDDLNVPVSPLAHDY